MSDTSHCGRCPLPPDEPCMGVIDRANFGYFCDWAAHGTAHQRQHIVGRSRASPVALGPPSGPGLWQKAANLAGAVMQHVATGMQQASSEVAAERLAICRTNVCGYYGVGDRCLHSGCGCFLTVKTGWADSSCPLEPPLWGPCDPVSESPG
jgi:hypothetical protein